MSELCKFCRIKELSKSTIKLCFHEQNLKDFKTNLILYRCTPEYCPVIPPYFTSFAQFQKIIFPKEYKRQKIENFMNTLIKNPKEYGKYIVNNFFQKVFGKDEVLNESI